MKANNRIIAFLLVLVLIASCLAACQEEEASQNESSVESIAESQGTSEISEASEETESSEPDVINPAPQMYKDAVEKFKEYDDFALSLDFSQKRASEMITVLETKDTEFEILSYGTDDMQISAEGEFGYWSKTSDFEEIFADGVVYQTYNNDKFAAEMSADEYIERMIPAVMFNIDLYGEVTLKETDKDGNSIIVFSSPEGVEEWAAPDYAVVNKLKAQTVIDAEGRIVSNECELTFKQGVVEVKMTVSQEIDYFEEDEIPEIEIPDENKYRKTRYIDAAMRLASTFASFENADVFSYDANHAFLDYAAAFVFEKQESSDYFNDGDYFLYNFSAESYTYSSQEGGQNKQSAFIDGNKITIEIDGESEIQDINNAERKTMVQSAIDAILDPCFDETYIKSAKITEIDGYMGIIIEGNELFYDYFRNRWGTMVYGQENYLESNYGATYNPVELEIVLTFDVDSYLPVAFNCDYESYYELNGEKYEVSYEKMSSFVIGNSSTYYGITMENYESNDTEPKEDDKPTPLFYKVTGENGQIMYLLGTIHIGDNRTAYLPQEIYDALENSDAFAMEIDVFDFMENMENYTDLVEVYLETMYYTDGSGLYKHIDDELYETVCEYASILGLGGYGDYISEYIDRMTPEYIGGLITDAYQYHGCYLQYSKGVESRLYEIATEKNIPIYEAEEKIDQIGMVLKYSEELQEYLLASVFDCGRTEAIKEMYEMYEAWCKGDFEGLSSLINASDEDMTEEELKLYEEYNKIMMTERDGTMLESAKEYLESGETVFMAVGLAHLLGEETGLVKTLAEAGYTVELVEYQ